MHSTFLLGGGGGVCNPRASGGAGRFVGL